MIDLGVRRPHLYSALRLTPHFRRLGSETLTGTGTGFVVADSAKAFFVVTNRHVVDPEYADARLSGYQLESIRADGYMVQGQDVVTTAAEWELRGGQVIVPPAESEDVALLPFTNPFRVTGMPLPSTAFTTGDLAQAGEFRDEIGAGDFLAVFGYPALDGTQVESPLVLPGLVSSDPSQPVASPHGRGEGRLFLTHLFSRQGPSGAPVFAVQRGIAPGGGIEVSPPHRPPRLIGINTGHWPKDKDGPASFSYAIRSDVVLELADRWRDLVQ